MVVTQRMVNSHPIFFFQEVTFFLKAKKWGKEIRVVQHDLPPKIPGHPLFYSSQI